MTGAIGCRGGPSGNLVGLPAALSAGPLSKFSYQTQEYPVASVCDVCGKGPGFGHNVSHSHRRTNRRWNPNIQSVRTPAGGGNTKKLKVCTSCIKAGKVVRA
jgi:large subunit ribosomal protein L28